MRVIIVAITGASGAIYGIRALEMPSAADVISHLMITRAGRATLRYERIPTAADVRALARHFCGRSPDRCIATSVELSTGDP
jgi:flavin prenyltransferase